MSDCFTCNKDVFKELDEFIDSLPSKHGVLIEVLHHAQKLFGYLPDKVQLHIAEKLEVSPAKVYGVVSFYSYFTTEPKGEYKVSVCMGTACFVKGADKVLEAFEEELGIKSGENTPDLKFSLESLRCVGACGLAPVVVINEKVYGRVKPEDVKGIVEEYYNQ